MDEAGDQGFVVGEWAIPPTLPRHSVPPTPNVEDVGAGEGVTGDIKPLVQKKHAA